jgi:two-component system, OmpR family, sensor kinase
VASVARGQERLLSTLEHLLLLPATSLQEALDQASDLLAESLGADKVDVFMYDLSVESLVAMGTSHTPMGARQHALGLARLPLANGGPTVRVFQTGQARLTGRADLDPDELRGIVDGLGVRSMMCVPLHIDAEPRGVISAAAATPDRFTEDDLRFVEAVSRWIGLLAQRAELSARLAAEAAEAGRRAGADELIAVLAHDLRNYLSPIRARLGMLRRWAGDQGHQRPLHDAEALLRSVDRLSRLVNDLLDSARLEGGLFSLQPQSVDLVALARETSGAFETEQRPVAVRSAQTEVLTLVDPDRIRQVLENLLSNALRYAPEGIPVEVEISTQRRRDGPWVVLTVSDHGPGIAPDVLPRLFERFATGARSPGLGIGLYLARRIAEAHGGTLSVDSTPGAGARFTLAVPSQVNELPSI